MAWRRDPQRNREAQREKYKKHKDKYLPKMRQYYLDNCEKIKKYVREWTEKRTPAQKRLSGRKACLRQYGITLQDFILLEKKQGGCCAICRATKPGGVGTWHVDHNHKTGEIRELLCHHCNLGLGNFKDDAALLRIASEYVKTAFTGLLSSGKKGGRSYAHGITEDQFDSILLSQKKRCKICRRKNRDSLDRWKVDHDHVTLVIRGILCTSCNFGISKFKDNPSLLAKAAKYIDKHTISKKRKRA